jgi:hypothetical protein
VDQSHGDVQPAPLAARQRAGLPVPHAGQVELLEQPRAALARNRRAQPLEHALVDEAVDRLEDPHRAEHEQARRRHRSIMPCAR